MATSTTNLLREIFSIAGAPATEITPEMKTLLYDWGQTRFREGLDEAARRRLQCLICDYVSDSEGEAELHRELHVPLT